MGDKIKKIYEALVDGAVAGKSGHALFQSVIETCPKATSKKIVKASLLALSDPHIRDANVLHVIYALAIKHRLDPAGKDDDDTDQEPDLAPAPVARAAGQQKSAKAKPEVASTR